MTTTSRRLLFALLGLLTLVRLFLIGNVELSADEAYYSMWSQYPDISYYSKGPGIAMTMWLSTHLFGMNAFGVRFFAPLLALATSVLMYRFARRLYGESTAFWAVLLLNVLPIYLIGSLLMTIDPLSMFFWMAAMMTFWRALEEEPGSSRWWLATGALIGLGFLCKWTNAMQILSIVLLLAITRRHRVHFRRRGFWFMLAVFVVFTIPPIIWNLQRDWITLTHLEGHLQTHEAPGEKSFPIHPAELGKYIAEHLGVYSPLVFLGMIFALWRGLQLARIHFKSRFLLAFAVPLLALYFGLSLREAGEANWTAPAMLSLGLLTVVVWLDFISTRRWARIYAAVALGLSAVMGLAMVDSDIVRSLGIPWAYEYDPSTRLRGWKSAADMVAEFRKDFEAQVGHPVFMIGNKYQTSAALAFYFQDKRPSAPNHPPVYIPESQMYENQFSFWPRYDENENLTELGRDCLAECPPALKEELTQALAAVPKEAPGAPSVRVADARRKLVQVLSRVRPDLPFDESFVEEQGVSIFAGHDALYITDRAEVRAPSSIKGGFERVEMIACIDQQRRGLPLRQWRIFACYGYHGTSL